jgi:nifR3 family TIM-barrel protein
MDSFVFQAMLPLDIPLAMRQIVSPMTAPVRPVALGRLALANNLTLAPMAGYTQRAQRLLARRYGAALCWTEMISAYEVIRPGRKTKKMLQILPEDRPLGLQIFGSDEKMMADAAAAAERLGVFDAIDVNLACPVRKIIGHGNGGAMLQKPEAALRILAAIRAATVLPLTIKVRRGFSDSPEDRELVEKLLLGAERLGLDAVTIHGRTVQQIYHGVADWTFVYDMAARLKIPVFGSGDLLTGQQIVDRLNGGPVAGVAVARGSVGQPWIFRDALAVAAGGGAEPISPPERVEVMFRHFDLLRDEIGDYTAVRVMRRFGMFYSRRIARARDARLAFGLAKSREDLAGVINEFFV